MERKRLEYIDVLKGIGIILVILGHANISGIDYIYSFHMPLFFFLTGYFFTNKYGVIDFIIKRIRTLIVPYLFFMAGSIILYLAMNDFNLWFVLDRGLFLNGEVLQLNSPLWFLPVLFFGELMYLFVYKLSRGNNKMIASFLITLSILGFLSKVILPFGIHIALTAVVFIGIGNLFRGYEEKIKVSTSVWTILLIVSITASLTNERINIYRLEFGNYFLFYLAAIAGILVWLQIAKYVKNNKILEYLGKNSLILMATHMVIFTVLGRLFVVSEHSLIIKNITAVSYSLIAVLVSMPVIYLMNRYTPFILGRTRKTALVDNKIKKAV